MIALILDIDSVDWEWPTSKLLFPIGKETILSRLQNQFRLRNIDHAVVTDDIDVMSCSDKYFLARGATNIVDVLDNINDDIYDYDDIIVMFDGVVMSDEDLDFIVNYDGSARFFDRNNLLVSVRIEDMLVSESEHLFSGFTSKITKFKHYGSFVNKVVNSGMLD